MYTIQLDSSKIFECTLKLKGVNIKNTKVNLVIESNEFDIKCRGQIQEDGKVSIPIRKLKGIINENTQGKFYLEVIADDTYFIPFNSEYVTELSKQINIAESIVFRNSDSPVQLIENSIQGLSTPTIKKQDSVSQKTTTHAKKIIKEMAKNKINIFKKEDKTKCINYIQQYIEKNNISQNQYDTLLKEIISFIIR